MVTDAVMDEIDHTILREKLSIVARQVAIYHKELIDFGMDEYVAVQLASGLQDSLLRAEMFSMMSGK